jgi:2-dehydro-3-deoxygluconokinase
MKKIVTFGELLLRFSKNDHLRLTQGDTFTSKYGGSEANVAVSLATQGENVTYITRLPDTPVGHAGAMNLAQLGVDTSHVLYGGQRIGTYYFEPAAGMRPPKVIYDRGNSAYFDLKPGMIPWHEILKDCAYFHVSGITAAISQQAADATFEALDIADEMGVTVCFDINYRKNLWRYEGANPRETLSRMLAPREQEIIKYAFGLGGHETMSNSQIARIFGITAERVRQIIEASVSKLGKSESLLAYCA